MVNLRLSLVLVFSVALATQIHSRKISLTTDEILEILRSARNEQRDIPRTEDRQNIPLIRILTKDEVMPENGQPRIGQTPPIIDPEDVRMRMRALLPDEEPCFEDVEPIPYTRRAHREPVRNVRMRSLPVDSNDDRRMELTMNQDRSRDVHSKIRSRALIGSDMRHVRMRDGFAKLVRILNGETHSAPFDGITESRISAIDQIDPDM